MSEETGTTAFVWFFIILGISIWLIIMLSKKPKAAFFITPGIAFIAIFIFMVFIDANRRKFSGFDIMLDMTIAISVLSSFCIVVMTYYAYIICQKESRSNSSGYLQKIDAKGISTKNSMSEEDIKS
jgi:hypothetical protein